MKGRHGTRMVQVITKSWLLQLVLDEPPEKLERSGARSASSTTRELSRRRPPATGRPTSCHPPAGQKHFALKERPLIACGRSCSAMTRSIR